jgi:broad specificity phosphatase PhoE
VAEPVIVDLLRHGEVAADSWAFRGSTDIALSQRGWRQMRTASAAMERVDHIATSPMQRCMRFAEELSANQQADLMTLDDMREINFGDWENLGFEQLEAEHGQLLQQFWQSPVGICPPQGEPFDAFVKRVLEAWQAWINSDVGHRRLLIAHGGVIRVLLAHILKMPMSSLWRLDLPYASWSRVSLLAGHEPRVLFMNRSPECAD